jgi:8-oxo-dGTP pyrophosphatase MutT (NUDIX family)
VQRTRWQDVERALQLRPPARVKVAVASKAAVAVVLRDGRDGLEVLFIHRAEHPEDPWSGQMAFPGGRFEPGDGDLSRTAVRETQEEIGLDLDASARLLGSLDETRAVSRMRSVDLTITPYVFRAGERAQAGLHTSPEVRSVHWIPLDGLIGSRHRALMDYPYGDGPPLKFPCFKVEGKTIWGLTYRMFANLQSLLEELER